VHEVGSIEEDALLRILTSLDVDEADIRVLFAESGSRSDGRVRYEDFFTWIFSSSLPSARRLAAADSGPESQEAEAAQIAASTPRTPPVDASQISLRRLLQEFRQTQSSIQQRQGPVVACVLNDDCLTEWFVQLRFQAHSRLQHRLKEYARSLPKKGQARMDLQVKFPPDYPFAAPEIWVQRPRMVHPSACVAVNGQVHMAALTSNGWSPSFRMGVIFNELHELVQSDGEEVDVPTSVISGYAEPPQEMHRCDSKKFPTANTFCKRFATLSAQSAVQLLAEEATSGNIDEGVSQMLTEIPQLDSTDKIVLSSKFAAQIYSEPDVQLPLMFELKTGTGRRKHCGIFQFMNGMPDKYVLLPTWLAEELYLEDGERIQVRCVSLPLITTIKVRPHSVEFYDFVKEAGGDVASILTSSLRKLSALTEGTSVPISTSTSISEKRLMVEVVELGPRSAVRIVDTDVTKDFEFKVDFEPAPDLEDEGVRKAKQEELLARLQERRDREEACKRAYQDRLYQKRVKAFERYQQQFVEDLQKAEAKDTKDVVDIAIRFPTGERSSASFQIGSPVSALIGFALRSSWASSALPSGIKLVQTFPKRTFSPAELIDKSIHRALLLVVDLHVTADEDEHEVQEKDDERLSPDQCPSTVYPDADEVDAGSVESDIEDVEELDVERCFEQTRLALEKQRVLQEEAFLAMLRQELEPAAEDNRPEEIAEEEQEERVRQLVDLFGAPAAVVRTVLTANSWNVETAMNILLDGGGPDRHQASHGDVPVENHQDIIDQVVAIADVTPEMAEERLAAVGWNVERAIATIFDV